MVDVNRNTKRQPHWQGKNPAQIPDAAPRSRTALDPVAYDNLIKQHGVRVKVYRSMFCPNVKSVDGGEHNIDCTLCNGSGYLDVDPIESVAYLSNQNFQEEMTVEGYHDGNTVGGTFLGGVELQYFTRVDLMDFTQPFYERVLKAQPKVITSPVAGSLTITFPAAPNDSADFVIIDGAISDTGLFSIVSPSDPADAGPLDLVFGNFEASSVNNVEQFYDPNATPVLREMFFRAANDSTPTGDDWATAIETLINSISTDATGTTLTPRAGTTNITTPATVRRRCNVTRSGRTLTLTQIDPATTSTFVVRNMVGGTTATIDNQGVTQITEEQDNLKYDCRRVNVIIDKEANQFYQGIDFTLTAQGNINWLGGARKPANGSIYSVHYESVIQYRTITAMHVNRFAQVPDRTTGKVAQVKMPEQWMLQKEFLIKRRDEYGNEIKATGIFGNVIDAQPLNPAPTDTIVT